MRGNKPGVLAVFLASVSLLLAPAAASSARAQSGALTTLYRFSGGLDGKDPNTLVAASDGNLYGTTVEGGNDNNGSVFRVAADGTFAALYRFTGGADGGGPNALVQARDGFLYGTAYNGGTGDGFGTVFRISTSGVFTLLHSFTGDPDGTDGANPYSRLLQAKDGFLYGTTYRGGGEEDNGTVFRISTNGDYVTLHSFTGAADGGSPFAGLIQASDGNFYGTTAYGGGPGQGTVFRIAADGTFASLYAFNGGFDGANPYSELVQASDGNLYGVTYTGGSANKGTIFRITPAGALTTLHSFTGGPDGANPYGPLTLAGGSSFYGTTFRGGTGNTGTVFVANITDGTPAILYNFTGGPDGEQPKAGLVVGPGGALYGTTGPNSIDSLGGTLFQLNVSVHPPFFNGEVALANNTYYLAFPNGNIFGYYAYLSDPHYLFHFDLGYEYGFDANDGVGGIYFYDFASGSFFYTSPTFPFPYLYDFSLNAVLYYFPDPNNPGRYSTNPRYFFNTATGQIITK